MRCLLQAVVVVVQFLVVGASFAVALSRYFAASVAFAASLPASYAVLIAPLKDQLFCQDWDTGRPRRSRCGDLLFRTFAVDDFDSGYLFFRIGVTVSPSGYLFFRCSRVVHWCREFVNSLTGRVLQAHNLINAGLA